MIHVVLPAHLRTLASLRGDVELEVAAPVTQRSVLDALESRYPMLRGTIRDQVTGQRRPFVRFFACAEDLSHEPPDAPLPDAVASGAEPLIIIGAVAGGQTQNFGRIALQLGSTNPSRFRDFGSSFSRSWPTTLPVITFWKASWKRSISSRVPMVMRV